MKSLLVLYSYHNHNTEKIANVFAQVLDAEIKTPQQINPRDLEGYSLIGFGSGIYGGKHHKTLLDLANKLTPVTDRKAFIFSTCAVPAAGMTEEVVAENHALLKEKLQSKGYVIVDEFSCTGLNTNSFLKLFGGINKGRPNVQDLERAEEFARAIERKHVVR